MYNWNTETALDALDPIKSFTPDQVNTLEYFAALESRKASGPSSPRQRLAAGLLKLAILLDGHAQAALQEARTGARTYRGELSA
jgi:hypothetical protein